MAFFVDEYGTMFIETREGVYTPEEDITEKDEEKENEKV